MFKIKVQLSNSTGDFFTVFFATLRTTEFCKIHIYGFARGISLFLLEWFKETKSNDGSSKQKTRQNYTIRSEVGSLKTTSCAFGSTNLTAPYC